MALPRRQTPLAGRPLPIRSSRSTRAFTICDAIVRFQMSS
jgi:hypothetical protein